MIDEKTRELVKKTLLERISLLGICRIFDVSMPWLLEFLTSIFEVLPDNLYAQVVDCDASDVEIIEMEADELWSFVGSKKNQQWLWLAIHRPTRQILAMHVGPRDQHAARSFYEKLPAELKKGIIYTDHYVLMAVPYQSINTSPQLRVRERQILWKDLIALSDSAVHI